MSSQSSLISQINQAVPAITSAIITQTINGAIPIGYPRKENIKSIIIKEFKGIDYLPDNLIDLMKYEIK